MIARIPCILNETGSVPCILLLVPLPRPSGFTICIPSAPCAQTLVTQNKFFVMLRSLGTVVAGMGKELNEMRGMKKQLEKELLRTKKRIRVPGQRDAEVAQCGGPGPQGHPLVLQRDACSGEGKGEGEERWGDQQKYAVGGSEEDCYCYADRKAYLCQCCGTN